MKTTLQLILIGLVIMLFSSCYTEKKARQQIAKADKAFPAILPEIARDLYPCTDLLKPDTVTLITGDTVVLIECPDAGNDFTARVDTVRLPGSTKTIRIPVTLPVQTRTITRWYEDSAKLKLGALALTKSAEKIATLEQHLTSMTGKRNFYRKWFWILIFIAGGLTVWTIRKIFI